jgi:hypothetical protein
MQDHDRPSSPIADPSADTPGAFQPLSTLVERILARAISLAEFKAQAPDRPAGSHTDDCQHGSAEYP